MARVPLIVVLNLLLAPVLILGVLGMLAGTPGLVLARDIAGVPVVVYAVISAALSVLLFTALGLLLIAALDAHGLSRYEVVIGAGATAGTIVGLIGGWRVALAGLLTGALCGAADLAVWRRLNVRPTANGADPEAPS